MELTHRRWIGRLVRVGIVIVAVAFVVGWFVTRRSPAVTEIRVQREAPAAEALGPGDLRIFSRDSSVNLILQGDKIMAGLSPQKIAELQTRIGESAGRDDTTGLGGSIARIVKQTVAENIGTHAVYSLADIRDIRYDSDGIIILRKDGGQSRLFGGTKVDGEELSKSFAPEDARRFVEAVRARLAAGR